jgi:BirA family biotin operon repressor/biotin-[acetyl-CoA-carboxylase] ligase
MPPSESSTEVEVIHYHTIDSTQSEAIKMVTSQNFSKMPFCITADIQTAGIGRLKRQWSSIPDNLHASLVINTSKDTLFYLPYTFGLAIANALQRLQYKTKPSIKLKWPNDVLLNQKKVAGILINNVKNVSIIGFGVNILHNPSTTISSVEPSCLSKEGLQTDIASTTLLSFILEEFYKIKNKDFLFIKEQWLKLAYMLNEQVTINGESGIFTQISQTGAIVITNNETNLKKEITFGDVS